MSGVEEAYEDYAYNEERMRAEEENEERRQGAETKAEPSRIRGRACRELAESILIARCTRGSHRGGECTVSRVSPGRTSFFPKKKGVSFFGVHTRVWLKRSLMEGKGGSLIYRGPGGRLILQSPYESSD